MALVHKSNFIAMKRLILLFALFGLFGLFGCEQIDKLTQFSMDFNSSATIPSTTGISLPFDVFTPDVQTNSESTFAVNNTRKDMVEEVRLTSLNLTIESPTNGDFSFLESIEIYIAAEGYQETKIAWKENIAENVGNSLVLEVANSDLKDFIKQDKFTLKVKTITDEVIDQDYELDIYSAFFIDAKVLGQ